MAGSGPIVTETIADAFSALLRANRLKVDAPTQEICMDPFTSKLYLLLSDSAKRCNLMD